MLISAATDIVSFFGSPILQSFYKVCLAIDFVIYNLISWLYTVFITIAKARLFTSETIQPFIDRVYLIIGIGALFFAAYTFLTIIANPENLSKGNSSPAKAIKNVILGIVAITFIPTIFNFAYSVQGSVVDQNVIGKIFMTREEQLMDDSEQNLMQFGITMFEASFYVKNNDGSDDAKKYSSCYADAEKAALAYNDVTYFGTCVEGVASRHIQYNFILAGIIGIIVVYVFFTYCFDLGLRAIKLTFLQIISPIPCLLLMVPGQDKMFKTWLKDTLKTFFEVFLKIFIVVFCVYIVQLLREWFNTNSDLIFSGVSIHVINFAKVFIFLGVIMFMRKAPKLIEDAIGIKMDPKGLSLKQRLQDSGIAGFADRTAGAVGGMIASNIANKKAGKARLDSLLANQKISQDKYNSEMKKLNSKNPFNKAGLLGGYYGYRGGVKGIGTAYNSAYDMQLYSANGLSGKEVAGNLLRDNFGIQSFYDEQLKESKIKNDAISSIAGRRNAAFQQVIAEKVNQTNDVLDPLTDASKNMDSSVKAVDDYVGGKIRKETSDIKRLVPVADVIDTTDASGNAIKKFQLSFAEMNCNDAENHFANMKQHLIDRGMTEADAIKWVNSLKSMEKNAAGQFVDADLETAFTEYEAATGNTTSRTTVKSLKDTIDDMVSQYITDGMDVNSDKYDGELKRLVSDIAKAGDNKHIGKTAARFKLHIDPTTGQVTDQLERDASGNLVIAKEWEAGLLIDDNIKNTLTNATDRTDVQNWLDSHSYQFDASADLVDGDSFLQLKKKIKNHYQSLVATKAAELSNSVVDIPIFDDVTHKIIGTQHGITINQVLQLIEENNKIQEKAQKDQKLLADALNGIKLADEAVKKHKANAKPRNPNGGGKG